MGVVFSIASGQNYGHIYMHIYINIYIYKCDLYTGCVVFSGLLQTPRTLVDTYQSGALLLVRMESPISQHTAVLLGGGESRCPRWFCRRRCDVLV